MNYGLFFKGLIDYCLTCTKLYFSYIQDENTFNNNKNYIEMREEIGQPVRLLTDTVFSKETWVGTKNLVYCNGYNLNVHILFQNLQKKKRSLACLQGV